MPAFFSLQANCIDSTAAPEAVFASEVKKMSGENMKPQEQLTLEPYERDHAVVVGVYRYICMKIPSNPDGTVDLICLFEWSTLIHLIQKPFF